MRPLTDPRSWGSNLGPFLKLDEVGDAKAGHTGCGVKMGSMTWRRHTQLRYPRSRTSGGQLRAYAQVCTVDRADTPTSKRSGNLVHGGDHGERINHLIVNQRPHDVPVAVERKAVQLGLQIPPAV
jgi:hypothetical protein